MNDSHPFFFGKLPDHDDFVRYNASGPDFRVLDQWLQEGLFQAARHFSSDWADVYRGSSPYQFCIQAEASELLLIGIVWPSHDKSGRNFPFVVALRDHREGIVPGMAPFVPVLYKDFLRQSSDLASAGMKGLSLSELTSGVGRLSAPSSDEMGSSYQRFQDYLDTTTSENFWARQLGDFEDRGKFLLVKNLLDVFGPVIRGQPARSSLGVRFPLRGENPFLQEDACFWILLGSQLLRNLRLIPNVLWGVPRAGERTYLYFFINRPPVKTLIPLLRPSAESDVVYRLDEDNRENAAQSAAGLPPRYRSALESKDLTLRGLLGEVMR